MNGKKQSFLSPACGRGRKKPKNFRSERENLRIIEENKLDDTEKEEIYKFQHNN